MIGERLGPYEIIESIGSGGMGEVWKAQDTRLGRIVAIKKVKEQHNERFKQEARSIAALNHPYICQLHDIGPNYLVLEYVEGKSLSSPLPEKEAVRLAIQIATALEAAHKKGIIHRDLKPSNIMVTDEGSVKLLDFGLAKLYEQDASISSLPTADMPKTEAGAVLGTVAYMSPEQAQGKPADARSDIFSFGLVLYEMLSGRRAFSGESPHVTVAALLRDEPPPLQISSSFEKVLRRCLAKQPSRRFQTTSEVKAALEKAQEEIQSESSGEQQPSIAVLPFVNMSGDKEQEYFSDGLAEEIINALTQIPALKVTARTSSFAFRGKEQDITRIAEMLRVRTILEGSVRKAGNRIRITAQLVNAADGYHVWSQRYDRDLTDIFAVQDEIAAAITGALQVKLSTKPASQKRYEPNLAAHEAYLKARYHLGKIKPESVALCKKYYEQAIELDPVYALAHCDYADHNIVLASTGYLPANQAMPLVRKEAQRALDINPSFLEARAMLGVVASFYDYDWEEAKRQYQVAIDQEPVLPRVRLLYGFFYLLYMGRTEEAIEQIEKALRADPLNILSHHCLAWSLYFAGRLADAQVEAHKILELEENHAWAMMLLAYTYAHKEKWADALHFAEKASPMLPMATGTLAGVLYRLGEVERSAELVKNLKPTDAYGIPFGLFSFYFIGGENDKAADWLEKAIEQRDPSGIFGLKLIRSSPRWLALAKMVNLPEEARL